MSHFEAPLHFTEMIAERPFHRGARKQEIRLRFLQSEVKDISLMPLEIPHIDTQSISRSLLCIGFSFSERVMNAARRIDPPASFQVVQRH